MRRALAGLAIAAAPALLAGCVPGRVVTPSPTPSQSSPSSSTPTPTPTAPSTSAPAPTDGTEPAGDRENA